MTGLGQEAGKVTMYEVFDADDNSSWDLYAELNGPDGAKDHARDLGGYIVEHTYTWEDSDYPSELDFRDECAECGDKLTGENRATNFEGYGEEYEDACVTCAAKMMVEAAVNG